MVVLVKFVTHIIVRCLWGSLDMNLVDILNISVPIPFVSGGSRMNG